MLPGSEGLPVVQGPLCQVESSLPGHQAGGSLWDQSYILQQADSVSTGLQDTNTDITDSNDVFLYV